MADVPTALKVNITNEALKKRKHNHQVQTLYVLQDDADMHANNQSPCNKKII